MCFTLAFSMLVYLRVNSAVFQERKSQCFLAHSRAGGEMNPPCGAFLDCFWENAIFSLPICKRSLREILKEIVFPKCYDT